MAQEPPAEPYERIRTALEAESKRNAVLQPLQKAFFHDAHEYLEHLRDDVRAAIEKDSDSPDVLRAYQERQRATETLQRLVERRIQKILDLARRASRPGARVEPDNLLPEEQELYERVAGGLGSTREHLLGTSKAAMEPVLVLQDLPPVTGTDLRVYNLKAGDVVVLPQDMAGLLVSRGAARPVRVAPVPRGP